MYELLNTDVSDNDMAILPPKEFIFKVMNSMFPIVSSSQDNEDTNFVKGHEKTIALKQKASSGHRIDVEEIMERLVAYRVSWELTKNYSSIANYISIIFFVSASYGEQDDIYFKAIVNEKPQGYLDVKKHVLRDRPDTNKLDELAAQRKAFFRDHEELIMEYIKALKSTVAYYELADYFLACMYFVGFVDNDFDFETNQRIALELLSHLCKIENHYALAFITLFE